MMKKLVCTLITGIMVLLAATPGFATFEGKTDIAAPLGEEINVESVQRYREYFSVTKRTDFWKEKPYSEITNTRICYLDPGDTLYYYTRYVDYNGDAWWYCKILSCAAAPNLKGSYGYISASAVENVIEGGS